MPPNPAPPLGLLPPVPVPVPVDVGAAPVGDAPPVVGAGALPASEVPPESAPESAVPEESLPFDAADDVEDVVELVVVVSAAEAPTLAEAPPGTVSVGAPAVFVVLEPPLPQAARPSESASPASAGTRTALSRRVRLLVPLLVTDIAI